MHPLPQHHSRRSVVMCSVANILALTDRLFRIERSLFRKAELRTPSPCLLPSAANSLPNLVALLFLPIIAFSAFPPPASAQAAKFSSISPTQLLPGAQVTLTGSGFGATQGKGYVDLWNSNFAPVVSWSNTRIVVTVPAGTAPGKAFVRQNGAWSNGVAFTMTAAKLSSISPASLAPGLLATLTGTGFGANQGNGYVDLWNANYAPVVSWSNTQIVVRVPAGTVPGKAFVRQNGTWSNGLAFAMNTATGTLRGSPVNFNYVQMGSSSTQSSTLTNVSNSTIAISKASAVGAGFSMSGLNSPLSLSPGGSITFKVTFAPKTKGEAAGDIMVTSNASDPNLPVPLTGVGLVGGTLTLTPATANLGQVAVGSSKALTATLSATSSNVVISSATTTSPEFTLSGVSFPMTIAAGQTASVPVKFTPQSSGGASGQITFVSNAANSPAIASLSGTGVAAAAQHNVDLSWNASASTVTGYNVYRGTQSGGPYTKTNSSPDASTAYTDGGVQAGQTYYYVVTGVNAQGQESKYSNEVKAAVPSP